MLQFFNESLSDLSDSSEEEERKNNKEIIGC